MIYYEFYKEKNRIFRFLKDIHDPLKIFLIMFGIYMDHLSTNSNVYVTGSYPKFKRELISLALNIL